MEVQLHSLELPPQVKDSKLFSIGNDDFEFSLVLWSPSEKKILQQKVIEPPVSANSSAKRHFFDFPENPRHFTLVNINDCQNGPNSLEVILKEDGIFRKSSPLLKNYDYWGNLKVCEIFTSMLRENIKYQFQSITSSFYQKRNISSTPSTRRSKESLDDYKGEFVVNYKLTLK